jgi:hypothetical protein
MCWPLDWSPPSYYWEYLREAPTCRGSIKAMRPSSLWRFRIGFTLARWLLIVNIATPESKKAATRAFRLRALA